MFKLEESFIDQYRKKQPDWGSLGYITFLRSYSRTKDNGEKESFCDTLERVVNGTIQIQEQHCLFNRLPWKFDKAQRTAQRMFQAMWQFKFLPPGRGLWAMGTEHIKKCGGAALNNCAFVSTGDIESDPTKPFTFLMDMMMLGVGVGFDLLGAGRIKIISPAIHSHPHLIEDSREGWVESLKLLLNNYSKNSLILPSASDFDYSQIRPAGQPLKLFGGISSGPKPLIHIHTHIHTHTHTHTDA